MSQGCCHYSSIVYFVLEMKVGDISDLKLDAMAPHAMPNKFGVLKYLSLTELRD